MLHNGLQVHQSVRQKTFGISMLKRIFLSLTKM